MNDAKYVNVPLTTHTNLSSAQLPKTKGEMKKNEDYPIC